MTLTNQDRRVVANLSIPRNVANLKTELLSDPYSGVDHSTKVADLLNGLADEGLVVSMGDDHESPGQLAASLEGHPTALPMPDEKAQIFEARLSVPQRSWRFKGEQWIMTQAGFDALHDPSGLADPTPLPTAAVEQLIHNELARVTTGDLTDTTLGDKLLEEEYAAWAKDVAAKHEEATGEKVMLPLAGGAGYSDATELLIIDPENGKGSAYTETAPWFMAAVTVAVTDADTGTTITEANYTGYARKSVAAADMNAAAAGTSSNANAITFAACTGGTSAVIGFAKCVSLTLGRVIKFGTCTLVNVSSTQQPLNFAIGAFTTTLD